MYRLLDPQNDWSFFDPDFRVQDLDRALIRPFSTEAARTLWEREVSASPLQRHPMLLPEEHWLKPQKIGPNWREEWERYEGNHVSEFIRSMLRSPDDGITYFIYMREDAYEAPARVMIKQWRAWVALEDEGPFILNPGNGNYVGFGPNGRLFGGCRLDE